MPLTLAALAGRDLVPEGAGGTVVTGLTADSRNVRPGFAFAALPGTQTDGAKFIPDALAAGASAIVAPCGVAAKNLGTIPLVKSGNPRRLLAQMAARFYGRQPDIVAAVTGTNGKTSVTWFLRQIWQRMGIPAACLGTTGLYTADAQEPVSHTTPDPVVLHDLLSKISAQGIEHLAIEASSHGLEQNRLDGVRHCAGAFTNISRDHLDYHPTFDDYFNAKMRLFEELLQPAAAAVINADCALAEDVVRRCLARGLHVVTVGTAGEGLTLTGQTRHGYGQLLTITGIAGNRSVYLPLVGDFQASNALVAAGLAIATGGPADVAILALENISGAIGRLELVAHTSSGAPVFVDYAHTPDALAKALGALRAYTTGRLAVVFGCGGDRDKGKRPLMGTAAAQLADVVYVTDDNPRSEDPASIRRATLKGCPGGIDAGERETAIHRAMDEARSGDVVLVAGKGHETGQTIAGETLPFSDQQVVRDAAGSGHDV